MADTKALETSLGQALGLVVFDIQNRGDAGRTAYPLQEPRTARRFGQAA